MPVSPNLPWSIRLGLLPASIYRPVQQTPGSISLTSDIKVPAPRSLRKLTRNGFSKLYGTSQFHCSPQYHLFSTWYYTKSLKSFARHGGHILSTIFACTLPCSWQKVAVVLGTWRFRKEVFECEFSHQPLCARDNNPSKESAHQAETWCSRRSNRHDKNNEQQRKTINTIFNEVRKRAYVLGARGREILLIQQSIQSNTEEYLRELSGDS